LPVISRCVAFRVGRLLGTIGSVDGAPSDPAREMVEVRREGTMPAGEDPGAV
jgi:hypothetical protein